MTRGDDDRVARAKRKALAILDANRDWKGAKGALLSIMADLEDHPAIQSTALLVFFGNLTDPDAVQRHIEGLR